MNLIIPQELAQAILNYLVSRPYVDVFQFIEQLKGLQRVEEKRVEEKSVN